MSYAEGKTGYFLSMFSLPSSQHCFAGGILCAAIVSAFHALGLSITSWSWYDRYHFGLCFSLELQIHDGLAKWMSFDSRYSLAVIVAIIEHLNMVLIFVNSLGK